MVITSLGLKSIPFGFGHLGYLLVQKSINLTQENGMGMQTFD